jgi:hypothetical protein
MSDPKLLRITKLLSGQLSAIQIVDGYHTNLGDFVVRGRLTPNESECPFVSISISQIEVEDASPGGTMTNVVEIDVVAFDVFKNLHPEDVAVKMMQDIHRAIEVPPAATIPKDDMIGRVLFQSESIKYPEASSSVVSAFVTYQFRFNRRYGDPIT